MNKKIMFLASVVLMVVLSGSASAANVYWIGVTSDWNSQSNWGGTDALPTTDDWVDIRHDSWIANFPVITTGQTAFAGDIRMNAGYGDPLRTVELTISGGELTVDSTIYIGNAGGDADVILNSGTITSNITVVGSDIGNGELHINGGTFNVGTLGAPQWWSTSTGTGQIHLDGGIIYADELVLGTGGIEGWIDITDGTLVMSGDARTTINDYISSGHITAYGSNDPNLFTVEYNGLNTTVTVAIPKLARNPTPANYADNVSTAVILSWEAPTAVSNPTYNVYFGTDGNALTLESEGQTELSYDPNLEFATQYYWRIDVNDPNGGNPVIHTGLLWTFSTGGKAYNPSPEFKETVVANNVLTQDTVSSVSLSWQAAPGVVSHEVYFGTNFDDVNSADTSDTTGIYKGSQGVEDTNYGPLTVKGDVTYYWRIDEVNEPNRWKGDIWSFSVPFYFYSGEDFEAYGKTTYLRDVWKDGTDVNNNTGSIIELQTDNTKPVVHEGHNSMKFEYDNSGSGGTECYSEIRGKCIVKNWTKYDVRALTLFFYGQQSNTPEQLYITLESGNGNRWTVNYPDLNDLNEHEWHVWNIDLQDFNDGGVNLMDVNNVYIGFGDRDTPVAGGSGTVYFDDIRLHQSRCVPEYGLSADLSGDDCTVNFEDLEILADDWLNMSMSSAVPPDRKRIYLLGGQSNMVGVGLNTELPAQLQLPQPNVQIYAAGQVDPCDANSWGDLRPGLGFNEYCFGPEITFGRDMDAEQPGDGIILIKYSVGGTSLWSDWHAPDINYPNGGPQYEAFMNTVTTALGELSLGYDPNIVGMIWMQGESDSSDLERAQAYEQNLTNLIQSIRSDLGVPNMPFVIGQISNQYGYTYGSIVQQAQYNVSQTLPNTALVITEDLTLNSDNIHYDAAGQIALGTRFAEKLILQSDINADIKVDFKDFAELALQWLETKTWP